MSTVASSDTESVHSAADTVSEAGEPEEGTDTASEEFRPATAIVAETVREVFVISEEDAREHEDAVELVNWSTFDDWKRPWHIVKLWEGSVYDEMTLWGSIPLQNDKLRKVRSLCSETLVMDVDRRPCLIISASTRKDSGNIDSGISTSFHSKSSPKSALHKDVHIKAIGTEPPSYSSHRTKKSVIQ